MWIGHSLQWHGATEEGNDNIAWPRRPCNYSSVLLPGQRAFIAKLKFYIFNNSESESYKMVLETRRLVYCLSAIYYSHTLVLKYDYIHTWIISIHGKNFTELYAKMELYSNYVHVTIKYHWAIGEQVPSPNYPPTQDAATHKGG